MWQHDLTQKLNTLEAQHLYRQRNITAPTDQAVKLRVSGKTLTNFCSNDYLGLRQHPKIKRALINAVEQYGVGSGSAHLVCGHSQAHHDLEKALAEFTGRERALIFSSGYMANIGTITALSTPETILFADKLNHASLNDGMLLSRRPFKRYRHADLQALEKKLSSTDSPGLIISDSVFSMDGDIAPLTKLSTLAQKYQANLMIDDAHGFGILGKNGKGTTEFFNLSQKEVPVLMGTFGKALGTFGAFVAANETIIETLIQSANSYIYTTALPPAIAYATQVSLSIIQEEAWRREHLQTLIKRFKIGSAQINLPLLPSDTPIQPIIVGSSERAIMLSEQLKTKGLWVKAIRPPTVPRNKARLRVTLNAQHTEKDIDQLLSALEVIWHKSC